MGGELKVRSQLGQGSEFYFTVTLPKPVDVARLYGELLQVLNSRQQ